MPRLVLTPAHVDAFFAADDADDGRALFHGLPVRVLRKESGRSVATGLVTVGSVSVEVILDGTQGETSIDCWCSHDGAGMCAHAAAAVHALASAEPPLALTGTGAETTRRTPQPPTWQKALERVISAEPDDDQADPPSDIALLFAVREAEAGDPPGAGIAIRPAVRGKGGTWVRGEVTWKNLAAQRWSNDPRARVLGEIEALFSSRVNFPALVDRMREHSGNRVYFGTGWTSEWIRLDATPARGLWELLRAAHDAGVVFVADEREQREIAVGQIPSRAAIDLRMVRGTLWVDPVITRDDRAPEASDASAVLSLGAPTIAVARAEGTAITDIVPLEAPATDEFDRLRRGGRLTIPAVGIEDFQRDYLPHVREVAPLFSSDESFEIPLPPRPVLVLAVRHADPVARLFWEWDYPNGARRDGAAEREIMSMVESAAGRFSHLLQRGRADRVFPARDLDRDETVEFLAEVLPAVRALDDVRYEPHSEVPAYAFATEEPLISFGADPGGHDWFELNIVVTIQGEPVSSSQLVTALSRGQTYFRLLSGTVFPLVDERFARLRDVLTQAKALHDTTSDRVRIPRYQFDIWQELAEIGVISSQEKQWFAAMRQLGADRVEMRHPPSSFTAELREYQREGFSWLDFLRRHRLGGILADDMGLGKTVQVLAALAQAREDEPDARFLVVTPTSVVGHWVAEAERFAPALGATAIRDTAGKRGTRVADAAGNAALVVTSYAIFRLDHEDFAQMGFRVLVLDEAQQVKNTASRGYALARTLDVPTKFAITGTPMENNLMELFAIATLVAPGLFGTRAHFRDQFQRQIERERNASRRDRLRARLRPFLMRRTKEQVAPELPPKTEQTLEVVLHPAHQRAYERRFRREQQKLLGLLDDVEKNRIQILASLTTLRMHALDPSYAGADGGSAKLDKLGELLDEIVADGHRVLVFSQFTSFLGLAAQVAEARGIRYAYLDGSTPHAQRARAIDRFSAGEVPAFFLSLKAGGTGLNLTAADYCVVLDPWWNPAAEAQAVDRAHRIGQTKPVMVYRLISAGTIEQKVLDLQSRKRRLFEEVLAGAPAEALGADDYRALLGEPRP
ncbi:DEAD/DEAH box helicase [Microbacterium amylolyticum]|uniref:Superfamily II DNA or RNA helicase n=1 Tax=Microbacterium amylolyticum TaxID=936337 RepID=A0ABS4ZI99_9MICO|nr:DEAD/DEAH box helicase [Microbacterium amylolyticum]MBP2436986.1 superfamily II DNA or RNA helicase [Microbacterium amylolyticum]